MSPTELKERTCIGKKIYRTANEARDTLYQLWLDKKINIKDNIRPYRCPFCNNIHIGHGYKYYK